ncbi:MAG: hypothetical protein PHF44_01000 [Candidatus Pacebacteria bacterium]|nr:hypothetical protein [Candidatus Paceibacterota bacterium]
MKILIAYYSKTGNTEKAAELIKDEFEARGHMVDMEKVLPEKEHTSFGWGILRIFKSECRIRDLEVKNVSEYDVICVGSPNWTKISLPMARYLKQIEGLENKNIGLFSTTAFIPALEWYFFSAYLLNSTFLNIVEEKAGRVIDSILLSSGFKKWSSNSEYGKKIIKRFCETLESPITSFQDFFLKQKEIKESRILIVFYSVFLFASLLFQIIAFLAGRQFFSFRGYLYFFTFGFLIYLLVLILLRSKQRSYWGKYLFPIFLVFGWTMLVMFFPFTFDKVVIFGYISIFMVMIPFQKINVILLAGILSIFYYVILFFLYFTKETLSPGTDLPLLIFNLGIVAFITRNLQEYHLAILRTQDKIEAERAVLGLKIEERTKELTEMSEILGKQGDERTRELQEKIKELERFNKLTVGRELKMIELKEEVKKLTEELNKYKGRI